MSKSDTDRMHKGTVGQGKTDQGKMDKKGAMDKAAMSDKDMQPMKLNVKSFKMISANCP